MGTSDNEMGVGDCSVGSIVWVRRRNGSWWPGKILGTEDLSAAHLMSPRSGTPVKLLGREDASVDWYNLEKSKRVKAFRCGEFDDCIERAESAQGMPPKRREKYARREDAILHALELEKQLVESKHGQSGCPNGKISKSSDAAKEITTLSGHLGNHDDKHLRSIQHLEERDSNLEEMRTDQGKGSQLEVNNNNDSELIPRMRDLLDLGIGVPASKHKLSPAITSNRSGRPLLDENTRPPPSGTLITINVIQTYSKGLLGRKRKSHAIIPDESLVRKHDKCRPLVQVLQSSPDVPVQQSLPAGEEHKGVAPHAERRNSIGLPGESSYCLDGKPVTLNSMELVPSVFEVNNHHPAALNKENTSGSSESTETDSSGTDSLNSDADGDMLEHPDATLDLRSLERLGAQAQHRNMSLKEPYNLVFANDAPRLFPQDFDLAGIGVSQWKNKGKRNSRRLGKKSTDITDRRPSGGSMYGSHLHVKDGSGFDDPDSSEKILSTQGQTDDYRGNLLISTSMFNCSDGIVHKRDLRGHCEDSSNSLDCAVVVGRHGFPGRTKPVLVDVDVKVQPKYQREHVPMISLMSKLNGKAIIGHPIQIEALEDGSSDILLAAAAAVSYGEMSNNDDTALPSMWRTARRTSHNRVPRSHPSAKLVTGQTADLQFLDQDKKGLVKELNVVSSGSGSGHKASLVRKSSCASGLPANKKFSRKPLKKISLSSGQKTKTLSSIGVEGKASHNRRDGGESNYCLVNGGLIKVDSGPPAVACIPVKLVFSRFFEDLIGRHQ